jgi:hypothetical protein
MNAPPHDLAARRARLLAQAQQERELLVGTLERLSPALRLADRAVETVHYLRTHPHWVAIAVVLAVILKPRRALRLASRAWVGWRALRSARRLLQSLGV